MKQKMSAAEMRMIRWIIYRISSENRIINDYKRQWELNVRRIRKNRIRWFGHFMRRDNLEAVWVVI